MYLTCILQRGEGAEGEAPTNGEASAEPLSNVTNGGEPDTNGTDKSRIPRAPRQRGPPEDGIPSKNKVMVANLPYDLSEEKV